MKKGDQNRSTFPPKLNAVENFLSLAAVEQNSPKSGAPKILNSLSPKIGPPREREREFLFCVPSLCVIH